MIERYILVRTSGAIEEIDIDSHNWLKDVEPDIVSLDTQQHYRVFKTLKRWSEVLERAKRDTGEI